jgi:hypothetical protein
VNSWDSNTYAPSGLEAGQIYYWRIDEVNDFDVGSPWKGNVWSFETARAIFGLSAVEFEFTAVEGEANPADQMLGISNIGAGTLNWEITEDCNWLSVEPNSGSSTGEVDDVNLSVDISGLAWGIYNCNLTASDANAENSPQTIAVTLFVMNASPVMLTYDAESYAYAHAVSPFGSTSDTDTDQDFSSNSKVESLAGADATFSPMPGWYSEWQRSYTKDSVEGISDVNGANLISTFKGWGEWGWFYEGGGADFGSGGGDGNGYTSLSGKICIGVFKGYPVGSSGLTLSIEAEISGDTPGSWGDWDWWFKIWDDDPNSPLVLLNDGNMSAALDVRAGQVLNIEFYHEAEENDWPAAGLESTVGIDLTLPVPIPDFDYNWHIDFVDFSILAYDWYECIDPCDSNELAGDMTNDDCVDKSDLRVLMVSWLDCYVTAASAPTPANGQGGADPNGILVWSAGDGALEHDVYFGTDANAVGDANYLSDEFMGTVADANFDPCGLDIDSTYYWRIDEVGPRCTTEGGVWSFTTGSFVSWWKFDEGSGTTAYDSAGANNGTLNGDPNWVTGQIDGALSFDGVDDYVDCGSDSSLDITDAITVGAWVKQPNFGSGGTIAGKTNGDSVNAGYGLFSYTDGLEFNFYSGGTWRRTAPRVTIPANEWHHVVATFNGNNAYLYVDGEPGASLAYAGTIAAATGHPFHISFWRPGLPVYFDGTIDDVRIYDRALSAGEILQLYEDGL